MSTRLSSVSPALIFKRRELAPANTRWQCLPFDNVQERLYVDSLLGSLDGAEVTSSKLRRALCSLFPASSQLFGIELRDFWVEQHVLTTSKALELKLERGYVFNIRISCLRYAKLCDVLYVTRRDDIQTPLFYLPKMSDRGTFNMFGLEKVFVSQLARIPGVRASVKGSTVKVSLVSNLGSALTVFANKRSAWLAKDSKSEVEYFQALMSIGVKCWHVLKALFETAVLLRYKLNWKRLTWRYSQHDVNPMQYGARRRLRSVPEFSAARAGGVLGTAAVRHDGKVVSHIGARFDFDCSASLPVSVVYDCATVCSFLNVEHCDKSFQINTQSLAAVNLGKAGRIMFNSIIGQQFKSDCISKRDLIFLWKRLRSKNVCKVAHDGDARIVRSCGDIVLDWVLLELKRSLQLEPNADQVPNDVLVLGFKRVKRVVNKLFCMSELCQYAEQLNSLTELCHKLRLTYMGEGGVTFRTATESLRDVQRWHFGRVCPVESPEGQNIGLVCSYALFSSVASSGLIQTAFNKVLGGQLSNKFKYLDCFRARNYATLVLNKKLSKQQALCTVNGAVRRLPSTRVELCYPSAAQLFSPAVNLIPFLGYNDSTRALMAANMQKQAVPLIKPSAPIVGTGLEHAVMHCTGHNTICVNDALVVHSDSYKIVVHEYEFDSYRVYKLPLPWSTNQSTCFRVRATVCPGQLVKSGQHIIECQSSANSELALGANLLVAFMVWNGLNYEDSVVLSEDVVARGVLQSLHILECEVKLYKTLLGDEILADVFESDRCLTENGVVRVGSVVRDGDVLVGKFTPSRDSHNQLVYTDSCYKLPVGTGSATVVSIQFSADVSGIQASDLNYCTAWYNAIQKTYTKRMAVLAETNKLFRYSSVDCEIFCYVSSELSIQRAINNLYNRYCEELGSLIKQCSNGLDTVVDSKFKPNKADANVIEAIKLKLLVRKSIQAGDKISGRHGNKGVISRVVLAADMPYMADGTPIDIILNPLSVPSRMNLGQVLETHLGLISYKWGLEFKHILRLHDQLNGNDSVVELARLKLSELYPDSDFSCCDAVSVMETVRETCEGARFACHPFIKLSESRVKSLFKRVGFKNDVSAQIKLYDGKTGSPFDRKITVGSMYVLKLNHMVDDKLHARATGPYSIVTQQPLKGKANKGGQRLGEMEVWALQAYGVAFLLREALTVKSDDVEGRKGINNSILRGRVTMRTTWNESFLVLIREMCSLCLNIKLKAKFRG
ncbi:DNA-directed RNA polymerase subunit beta [Candidatus Hodgkinia cicadicola]|nr:DNA-directed RNA polymerase subunit beta [Candidatus Hodgkinia cicadicola]